MWWCRNTYRQVGISILLGCNLLTVTLAPPVLIADDTLRVPMTPRTVKRMGEIASNELRKPVDAQRMFCHWMLSEACEYMAGIYNKPFHSGITQQDVIEKCRGILLSSHTKDPQEMMDAVKLMYEHNIRFNHLWNGHMTTAPSAVPVFMNFLIDFINANMADPETPELFQLIEQQVIQWSCQLSGYDKNAGGLITSGGTAANMFALNVMRDRALNDALKKLDFDLLDDYQRDQLRRVKIDMDARKNPLTVRDIGVQLAIELIGKEPVLFLCEDKHYSWEKMGGYEGIGETNLVRIRVDDELHMDTRDLEAKIAQAETEGRPIMGVVATTGKTESGAWDPLDKIHEILKKNGRNIWLHADAAYGGQFFMCQDEKVQTITHYLHLADSQTQDQHKEDIPYKMALFKVKDKKWLELLDPDLSDNQEGLLPETMIDQRRFEALKYWAKVLHQGTGTQVEWLQHRIDMTRLTYGLFKSDPQYEMLHEPDLDLFMFRYIPLGIKAQLDEAIQKRDVTLINEINQRLNELNKRIKNKLQDRLEVFFSRDGNAFNYYRNYASEYPDDSRKIDPTIECLRFCGMSALSNRASMNAVYRIVSWTAYDVACAARKELGLGVPSPPDFSRETKIPEARVEKNFQKYFMHPDTRAHLETLGHQIFDLALGDAAAAYGITEKDIAILKGELRDFTPPTQPLDNESLLRKLAIVMTVAQQQKQQYMIPITAHVASFIAAAMNNNQIVEEGSPFTTYVEVNALELIAQRYFDYMSYTIKTSLPGQEKIKIVPGGVFVNAPIRALTTAFFTARNICFERVLRPYNDWQPDDRKKVSVTEDGLYQALETVRREVTHNQHTRMVVIASQSMVEDMKYVAQLGGMGPFDIIPVTESARGTVDGQDLLGKIAEQKQKGNIVIMAAVQFGDMDRHEANHVHRVVKTIGNQGVWVHAVIDDRFRGAFGDAKAFMKGVLRGTHSLQVDLQGLFHMPQDMGMVLFRDRSLQRHYLAQSSPYAFRPDEQDTVFNLGASSIEGSTDAAKAITMFTSLQLYGDNFPHAVAHDIVAQLDVDIFGAPSPKADRVTTQIMQMLFAYDGGASDALKTTVAHTTKSVQSFKINERGIYIRVDILPLSADRDKKLAFIAEAIELRHPATVFDNEDIVVSDRIDVLRLLSTGTPVMRNEGDFSGIVWDDRIIRQIVEAFKTKMLSPRQNERPREIIKMIDLGVFGNGSDEMSVNFNLFCDRLGYLLQQLKINDMHEAFRLVFLPQGSSSLLKTETTGACFLPERTDELSCAYRFIMHVWKEKKFTELYGIIPEVADQAKLKNSLGTRDVLNYYLRRNFPAVSRSNPNRELMIVTRPAVAEIVAGKTAIMNVPHAIVNENAVPGFSADMLLSALFAPELPREAQRTMMDVFRPKNIYLQCDTSPTERKYEQETHHGPVTWSETAAQTVAQSITQKITLQDPQDRAMTVVKVIDLSLLMDAKNIFQLGRLVDLLQQVQRNIQHPNGNITFVLVDTGEKYLPFSEISRQIKKLGHHKVWAKNIVFYDAPKVRTIAKGDTTFIPYLLRKMTGASPHNTTITDYLLGKEFVNRPSINMTVILAQRNANMFGHRLSRAMYITVPDGYLKAEDMMLGLFFNELPSSMTRPVSEKLVQQKVILTGT